MPKPPIKIDAIRNSKKKNLNSKDKSFTLFRIRRKSLDLNSFRAERWRRSMNSSPLRSTISSFSCSVDFSLISFSSSSLFPIITTDAEEGGAARLSAAAARRVGHRCATRMPWNEEDEKGFGRFDFAGKITVEIERLVIFVSLHCCCLLVPLPYLYSRRR